MNSEYPWFDACLEKLSQAYFSGRLPHGILITAVDGCGKKHFAEDLSQRLLCKKTLDNRGTGNSTDFIFQSSCGQCKSCLLFKAGTHPDYYLVDRLLDNKGKQKKSIGIDQIRRLTDKLADMAQLSGWRIALITSVSAMTTAAYNALLKTLEEPGERTLLILLADNLQRIPATIRSRCQIIQPDLRTEPLKKWLTKETGKAHERVTDALSHCHNAPLKAKAYIESDGYEQEMMFYQQCDQVLLNRVTPQELISLPEIEPEEMWKHLAGYFYQVEIAILKQCGLAQYQQLPAKLPCQLYAKLIEYNRAQFSGSNLQSRIQLQAILVQWFEAGRKIGYISNS